MAVGVGTYIVIYRVKKETRYEDSYVQFAGVAFIFDNTAETVNHAIYIMTIVYLLQWKKIL